MGLILGSRSKSTGGPRKPSSGNSVGQFFEMNSVVRVPSWGHVRVDVSGGIGDGPAAES